jgi:MFS family permease
MIEAYVFLAMFAVQTLAMSALYPTWFIRYWRRQAAIMPPEHVAQLYPGVDLSLARERFLARYRTLNACIAVLGLLLLGWLFSYLRRPDWDEGRVEILVTVYFLLQALLPLALVIWFGVTFNKAHKHPVVEAKRKATLQRRGLFDFVSPFTVCLAVLTYLLFVVVVISLRQSPFPGFAGFVNIVAITLVYALNAFVVYAVLYGKRPNPFETPEGRFRTMSLTVKSCIYSCVACVAFMSLNFTLAVLDWQRWEPFALSAFFVITALLSLMGMTAPPRKPDADEPEDVAPRLRGT